MKNVLKELKEKKFISEEMSDVLESIPGSNKEILKRQLNRSVN